MRTNHQSQKRKPKFLLTDQDDRIVVLLASTEHKILGIWARACAARVLPFFEDEFPDDMRPCQALKTLQHWIDTGQFSMAVIRKASLDAHAAAREVGEDSPARSAARAAGQAVATAHVRTHAGGAAIYALQAIHRAASADEVAVAVAREREWQYQQLLKLREG